VPGGSLASYQAGDRRDNDADRRDGERRDRERQGEKERRDRRPDRVPPDARRYGCSTSKIPTLTVQKEPEPPRSLQLRSDKWSS
jgi:hypothetical protein